eukprot:TRINITY_DN221_c0_g1_i5.p1 TRINITY_DN221_c0_g1~~TRINITY_DN221_c0_g1_i5.p1  ORF type:complete len:141 (-),score=15.77 TRINITY_DN221_c0_g1_i5:492-914(-)
MGDGKVHGSVFVYFTKATQPCEFLKPPRLERQFNTVSKPRSSSERTLRDESSETAAVALPTITLPGINIWEHVKLKEDGALLCIDCLYQRAYGAGRRPAPQSPMRTVMNEIESCLVENSILVPRAALRESAHLIRVPEHS